MNIFLSKLILKLSPSIDKFSLTLFLIPVSHDFIDDQEDFPAGPRLLTAFLYLNDVEEGGGTDFPKLGITVNPKKGMMLLWPSVLDSDPFKIDRRTSHQALPVEKGLKYAANAWIHMRDFKTPNDNNCT